MSALDGASLKPLISAAYAALSPVAEMDGRVLYSSIETLCPGRLFLMGLNPGAGQDRYHHIGASLLDIPNHHWNTYIDDDWGRGIGMHHTQKRVCYMLQALGLAPRAVFATNLVFAALTVVDSDSGKPHSYMSSGSSNVP